MYFFYFFFQAEDGIRDHCVTGVQTCALPILIRLLSRIWQAAGYPWSVRLKAVLRLWLPWARRRWQISPALEQQVRSEERRVGKECRARWVQCHLKNQ